MDKLLKLSTSESTISKEMEPSNTTIVTTSPHNAAERQSLERTVKVVKFSIGER